jgi:iron only hydrogenase large subunit-like protein
MKQIIATEADKCRGCASCVGVCPVGEANITAVHEGKVRILVDPEKCIVCGACLRVCPSKARSYNDDTESFFDALKKGEPIALIAAPAFLINFPNWKAILAWLKSQGATVITDASLGIEISTWAHVRYIERYQKAALITQPCPPIVSYIEKYRPELLGRLSPVVSPILCAAFYLKKVRKLPEKIAALTPCPAKADEFITSDGVHYNVTFKKLAEYLTAHEIVLQKSDFEFDNIAPAPVRALMTSGSCPESMLRAVGCIRFIGTEKDIDIVSSRENVYGYLDAISSRETGDRPVLLDALCCPGGCSNGVGGYAENPNAKHPTQIALEDSIESTGGQTRLFSVFDDTLQLTDYIKTSI